MNLKSIIKVISRHQSVINNPPVLFDIGASGAVNKFWKKIAAISVCVAFDADERDFSYSKQENTEYKEFITVNKIVVAKQTAESEDFYLTKSPHCSSLLEPDEDSLKDFHFSDYFSVHKKTSIKTVQLSDVVDKLGINSIDWFKTDSQGTDLRLFESLHEDIQQNTIVVEFEPGFIDAYVGEDKIVSCLAYFERYKNYFLTSFIVKGPLRISEKLFSEVFKSNFSKRVASLTYKKVPGWAEMTYMNKLNNPGASARDFILAWLFSTVQEQHEIAFSYARQAKEKFSTEPIFDTLEQYSMKRLRRAKFEFKTAWAILKLVKRRYIGE
jgi:hypothetical protein